MHQLYQPLGHLMLILGCGKHGASCTNTPVIESLPLFIVFSWQEVCCHTECSAE